MATTAPPRDGALALIPAQCLRLLTITQKWRAGVGLAPKRMPMTKSLPPYERPLAREEMMMRTPRLGTFSLAAIIGLLCSTISIVAANAAEIRVLSSVALAPVINELKPQFERATGNTVAVEYSIVADIRKRVLEGETADIIVVSRPVMDELQTQAKVARGSIADIAGIAAALTVRAGSPKPDISSAEALKRSLLAAKSIVYADPARGGLSGVHFARVLDRLGIAEQMKPKTILVPADESAAVVSKGQAEIGVAQTSEIVPVAGAQLVGPLPGEFGLVTVFSAGLGQGSKVQEAATSLIRFVTGPASAPVLTSKGMEPR
jgi:molybdate transport system substrate-binding protein